MSACTARVSPTRTFCAQYHQGHVQLRPRYTQGLGSPLSQTDGLSIVSNTKDFSRVSLCFCGFLPRLLYGSISHSFNCGDTSTISLQKLLLSVLDHSVLDKKAAKRHMEKRPSSPAQQTHIELQTTTRTEGLHLQNLHAGSSGQTVTCGDRAVGLQHRQTRRQGHLGKFGLQT